MALRKALRTVAGIASCDTRKGTDSGVFKAYDEASSPTRLTLVLHFGLRQSSRGPSSPNRRKRCRGT